MHKHAFLSRSERYDPKDLNRNGRRNDATTLNFQRKPDQITNREILFYERVEKRGTTWSYSVLLSSDCSVYDRSIVVKSRWAESWFRSTKWFPLLRFARFDLVVSKLNVIAPFQLLGWYIFGFALFSFEALRHDTGWFGNLERKKRGHGVAERRR